MLRRKWVSPVSLIFLLCICNLVWAWPFGPSKSRRGGALEFDAVVGAAGVGNYTTIEAALAAGKKTIFIKKGTYQPASDLTLSSGVQLIGESRNESIIDFNGQARQIISDGSSTTYSTGTITVNDQQSTVTGAGTTWLARTEDYIKLGTAWYEISSIDADDTITIVEKFFGETLAGQAYMMSDLNLDIVISNLTITGSQDTTGAIFFENTNNSVIRDCNISNNLAGTTYQDGINFLYSDHNLIEDNIFKNNKWPIEADYCDVNIIANNFLTNNDFGIWCYYGSENIIEANEIVNNDGTGISMGRGYRNLVRDNNIKNNSGPGVGMSTSHELSVIGNTISYNEDDGISYSSTEDYEIYVSGNTVVNNSRRGIEVLGDHCSVVGNYVIDNGESGIYIGARSGNLVSGNVIFSNDRYGIYASYGEGLTVTGNIIQENMWHGIRFYGSSHSVISGNMIEGNDSGDTATYDGINLTTWTTYGASYNVISGNRLRDNDRYEIYIADSDCTMNQIIGNSTYGTDHEDEISDSGTDTIILEYDYGDAALYYGTAPVLVGGPGTIKTGTFTGFTAAESKMVNITGIIGNNPRVIRVELYISNDTTGDENILCRLSFYSSDAMTEDGLLIHMSINLARTETNGGASATETTDVVDNVGGMVLHDPVMYLGGTPEKVVLNALPNEATKTLTFSPLVYDHADNTTVSKVAVIPFEFVLKDLDETNEIHAKLEFKSAPSGSANVAIGITVSQ